MNYLTTIEQLEGLYGSVGKASLAKETSYLTETYRRWIERSPFAILATVGPGGLDASPRGDAAPLVRVKDDRTILLPDRRGNNRIDSMRNLMSDPRVSLIFLVPGVSETVRVMGSARVCVDPQLLASFANDQKPPVCVLEIAIQSVFFQCARAMKRSRLWEPEGRGKLKEIPSAGSMLEEATEGSIDGTSYDIDLQTRLPRSLY